MIKVIVCHNEQITFSGQQILAGKWFIKKILCLSCYRWEPLVWELLVCLWEDGLLMVREMMLPQKDIITLKSCVLYPPAPSKCLVLLWLTLAQKLLWPTH